MVPTNVRDHPRLSNPFRIPVIVGCWLGVLLVAAFLRFDDLGGRPFHADEATGARITAHRLESGHYAFDPTHYHGPTLSSAAAVGARLHGQRNWAGLEKSPLRLVAALAGCLLVVIPVLGRRRFGDAPMLLAGLALATSPLLVYYSRMFIHEMLLAAFGVLALFQLAARRRWWPAGLWIGLMYATKETFVISMLAWAAAGGLLYLLELRHPETPRPRELLRRYGRPALVAAGLALAVSATFYTNGFRYWQGAADAVRTYFIYDTVAGHDKPHGYYLDLMFLPEKSGGVWWFETPLAALALVPLAGCFLSRSMPRPMRLAIRFLALAAAGHFVIYSLFAYKTPWLMVLPWAHVCLLAGFAAAIVPARGRLAMTGMAILVAGVGVSQFLQSRQASGRLASDDRNPYAYVPTSDDIEALAPWLESLDAAIPELALEPIAVIGSDYWPLPWYLRRYEKVGYWPDAPENLHRLPLVFTATAELSPLLEETHVPVPRGLRGDTPVMVWVRQDFWDAD